MLENKTIFEMFLYKITKTNRLFKKIRNMRHIILLCICLNLFSCGSPYDCNGLAENYRTDECLLVVEKIPGIRDGRFSYSGVDPIAKKECDCNSTRSNRWWADYKEYIEIGDTIIKKNGELVFSVHKRDTVLNFNFECGGKVYK